MDCGGKFARAMVLDVCRITVMIQQGLGAPCVVEMQARVWGADGRFWAYAWVEGFREIDTIQVKQTKYNKAIIGFSS